MSCICSSGCWLDSRISFNTRGSGSGPPLTFNSNLTALFGAYGAEPFDPQIKLSKHHYANDTRSQHRSSSALSGGIFYSSSQRCQERACGHVSQTLQWVSLNKFLKCQFLKSSKSFLNGSWNFFSLVTSVRLFPAGFYDVVLSVFAVTDQNLPIKKR